MYLPILHLFIGILLAVFLSIFLINVLLGPHMRNKIDSSGSPHISVLIPARNEAQNIGTCLESFLNQKYDNYQIYVLDDQSEDDTAQIVRKFTRLDSRVHLIEGTPLPKGWLGKNWACHQLSKHARGEILLFADADTRPAPGALRHTVNWMTRYNVGMFSVFPQQITRQFMEKLLVPLIDFILYTLLPLWIIYYFPSPLFAAANGQWIVFKRNTYEKIGGHESVKEYVVEDVEFSRLLKRKKIKTLTASGTGMVYTRMYRQFRDIWHGLSKIFFGLTGNNILVLLLVVLAMFLAYIVPYILLFAGNYFFWALVFIVLITGMRLIMALVFKHDLLISIFLHPIMIFFGIFIAINSFYMTKKGKLSWKGRSISGIVE